jgi:hypothetical protein
VPGCLKEIRNYPLYIRFRYSSLPQGDQELSALHPVQVFIAASRRSGTLRSTSGQVFKAASRTSGTIRSTSGSGIHRFLKEIRNYPLYIRFRYSWLPQGDQELSALHPVQVFKAASRRSGTIRCTSGSGIYYCLKEIRNYPLYIRFRYLLLPQGDQELATLHPVQVFMAASWRSGTSRSMVASRRSGTIPSISGSGIHCCLQEIRNYLLYIRFRYSLLPPGDQKLSALHLV